MTSGQLPRRLESEDGLGGRIWNNEFSRHNPSPGPRRSKRARKNREGSDPGFETPGSTVLQSEYSNRLPESSNDEQDLGGFEEVLECEHEEPVANAQSSGSSGQPIQPS